MSPRQKSLFRSNGAKRLATWRNNDTKLSISIHEGGNVKYKRGARFAREGDWPMPAFQVARANSGWTLAGDTLTGRARARAPRTSARAALRLAGPLSLSLTLPHPLAPYLTLSTARRCGMRHPCSSSRLSSIPLSCGARLRCIAGPGTTPIRHPFPLPRRTGVECIAYHRDKTATVGESQPYETRSRIRSLEKRNATRCSRIKRHQATRARGLATP